MGSSVKLISSDHFEFVVDRKAACVSNTIKQMLSTDGELAPDWQAVQSIRHRTVH